LNGQQIPNNIHVINHSTFKPKTSKYTCTSKQTLIIIIIERSEFSGICWWFFIINGKVMSPRNNLRVQDSLRRVKGTFGICTFVLEQYTCKCKCYDAGLMHAVP
jgi:hypothetical protein